MGDFGYGPNYDQPQAGKLPLVTKPADCVHVLDRVKLMTASGEYVSSGTVTGTRQTARGFTATWQDVGTDRPRRVVVPPAAGFVLQVIRGDQEWEVRGNPAQVVKITAGDDPTVFVSAGSVTAEKITVETVHLPPGTVTGPLVPTPAKSDEAQEKLVKPQEVRQEVLEQARDDEKVARQDKQLAAATEQLIREMGEAGWRSQYFTGDSGSLPWEKAKPYTAWKNPRDRYAVTGDEADLGKMLEAVDFTNPPDARALSNGQARTTKWVTKTKTWRDIDGRPHTSEVTRPVRGVPSWALLVAWVGVVFGFVFLMHVLGVLG